MKKKVLLSVVLTGAYLSSTVAQEQNVNQCNPQVALGLVRQQAEENRVLDESDKRIRILVRTASFLWKFEEATARDYFQKAFDSAAGRFAEKGSEKSNENEMFSFDAEDMRFTVIKAIAAHDREWARTLTDKIIKEELESTDGKKNEDSRTSSEILAIAREMAKSDPQSAVSFARNAFRLPLGYGWRSLLVELAEKNRTISDALFVELMRNYASAPLEDLSAIADYAFATPHGLGLRRNYGYGTTPNGLPPNPNLQKLVVEAFAGRIGAMTSNPPTDAEVGKRDALAAYFMLEDISKNFSQAIPNLLPTMQNALTQAAALVTADELAKMRKENEGNFFFRQPFEKRAQAVEDAKDSDARDMAIIRLIFASEDDNDFKQAESYLSRISEPQIQTDTTNYFYFQRSKIATTEKRFDDAKKYALKVPEISSRSVLLFDIAEAKFALKDPTASETLDEAIVVARKAEDSVEKAQVLLNAAFHLTKNDRYRANDLLLDTVKSANKMENPDLFTDTLTRMIMKPKKYGFAAMFTVPGFDLENVFGKMAKEDFNTALATAQGFEDRYLRSRAVMATVKNCLEEDKRQTTEKTSPKTAPKAKDAPADTKKSSDVKPKNAPQRKP